MRQDLFPTVFGARAKRARRSLRTVCALVTLAVASSQSLRAQFYVQSNLVSDLPGEAMVTDTNLVGAWGITASSSSPWWVNTTFSGKSLIINGAGQPQALVVTIPPTNGATATGIAFNGGNGFQVGSNMPARFIFATLNGTISGWSPSQPNPHVAVLKVNNVGTAGYTGLTLAQNNGEDFLYAADYFQNTIDVFDTNFTAVTMPVGAFTDERVPAGLVVFNVQHVGDWLYVTYAPTNVFGGNTGPGRGFVDVFDVNGQLVHRLQHGFWMNAPWGVTLAPADFGRASNHILVGMFGSGAIATFDPNSAWSEDENFGRFDDFLRNTDALPLIISKGLWGLGFGNGANSGATNTLYFASDFTFGGHFHGLFGTLTAVGPLQGERQNQNEQDIRNQNSQN